MSYRHFCAENKSLEASYLVGVICVHIPRPWGSSLSVSGILLLTLSQTNSHPNLKAAQLHCEPNPFYILGYKVEFQHYTQTFYKREHFPPMLLQADWGPELIISDCSPGAAIRFSPHAGLHCVSRDSLSPQFLPSFHILIHHLTS